MKFKFLSIIWFFLGFVAINAQGILNAQSPEELRRMREENLTLDARGQEVKDDDKGPLDYGYINDKDVLWAKVVWEVIDLNERINQPYYNSTDGIAYRTLSLFDALKGGIENGEITEVYDDEYFQYKITKNEAMNAMVRRDTLDWYYEQKDSGVDMNTVQDDGIDDFEVGSDKVKMVKVKGMWYIDKRMSEMRYRILGIAMMGPDAQSIGRGFEGADDYVDLFWVWYPDARKVLNKYTVYNPRNAASSITFDDMLNARRFNSIIYKSSDAMGDLSIKEYLPQDARAQLDESNRIKGNILERENDMWNY